MRSVTLLGRAGSSLFNSVVARFDLAVVLLLQPVDAAPSVQLCAQNFIGLAEPLKLAGQVRVLPLKYSCVSLKRLFLGQQVVIVVTALGGGHPEAFNVTSANVECFLFLFETDFGVPDLNRQVGIAALLEVDLLSKVVVLGSVLVIVTAKSRVMV